jgi:hypothetical protein
MGEISLSSKHSGRIRLTPLGSPGKMVSEITLLGDPSNPSSRIGVYTSSIRQSTSARSRSRHSIMRKQLAVNSANRKGQKILELCVIAYVLRRL